jgi:hypothetical protein
MTAMVTPTRGRPRGRPYLEHDARAVRLRLTSLQLQFGEVIRELQAQPEVLKYLNVMRPSQLETALGKHHQIRAALRELVDALRSEEHPAVGDGRS